MRKVSNISKVLWGLALIALGTIFALNTLGITDINIFFEGWWTLFIIIPSAIGLFDSKDRGGSIIGLIVGVVLLLAARDIITYRIVGQLIVPFILVVIGFNIIWSSVYGSEVKEKVNKANTKDLDSVASVFSDEYRIVDKEFKGAVVDSVFGHAMLDLRNAKIEKEAMIKASSIFGSIDILAPKNVFVKVKSNKIFGTVEKQTFNEPKESGKDDKILYIEASSIFGGIKIK